MDDQGVHLHIHLPDSLTEMVKATGDRAIHVHLPDGLEKVVRDLGAEVLHERGLMRLAITELGELLKLELAPKVVIPAPIVNVAAPEVKIRPAEVVVHLAPQIRAVLGPMRQTLVRDLLDGAVTAVVTTPEDGASG